jgi:HK97 family phage portal protein
MALINGNSFLNRFNLFSRGNDPYIVTPQINFNNLLDFLQQTEQEISVDGNESEILRTTPQLKAVIYRRASMLANGRFKHIGKNGEEIEDSKFVKLLENPNPFQAGNEWLMQQDIQKSTYGNAFIFMLKGSRLAEIPAALWNLSPQKMIVDRSGKLWRQTKESAIITQYKMNADSAGKNEDMKFDPVEILHRNIQDVDDPIVGTSPFHALKMPISNIRAAYGFRNVIMTKKGAIGMITNNSKGTAGSLPFTKDERLKVDKQFVSDYGITERQQKIIMTAANLKWNPMSYPTKDMMLFEEVDEDTRQIIDAYGLNEALFSLGKGTTFDNYEQGEIIAYQDTIIPEGNDLANGLTKKFGLNEKDEKLILDFSHVPILQTDQERASNVLKNKAEAATKLQQLNMFTADEIKDIIGMK